MEGALNLVAPFQHWGATRCIAGENIRDQSDGMIQAIVKIATHKWRLAVNIADALIKQIRADSSWMTPAQVCDDDQLPEELLLPEGIFDGAPELDVFRKRDPDSIDGEGPQTPGSTILLGTYQHMHSPGVITLYRHNIEAYWRSLLKHAQKQYPFIYAKDADRVLHQVMHGVYQHERFHYVCDFCRRLFNGSIDRWHEEALAVAAEWDWLKTKGGN